MMQKSMRTLNGYVIKLIEKAKERYADLLSLFKRDPWCFLAVAAAISIILLNMVVPFTERRGRSLLFLVTPIATMFFIGPLAVQKKLINNIGSALLLAYAVWLGVSRIILGDYTYETCINRVSLALFAAVLGFNLPYFFSEGSRKKVRAIIADLAVIFCMLTALLVFVFVVLEIRIELWGAYHIYESFVLSDGRLYCFHEHPNIVAELFVIGFCLAIMRAFDTKRKPIAAAYLASAVIFFAVLVMTDSRACVLVACAVSALAVGLAFFSAMRGKHECDAKSRAVKIAVGILCGVVAFFAAYSSTDVFRAAVVNINSAVVSARTDEPSSEDRTDIVSPTDSLTDTAVDVSASDLPLDVQPEQSETTESDDNADKFVLSDRAFSSVVELTSLNSRTLIYKYAFHVIKENPKVLLFGERYTQEMIHTTEAFGYETTIAHWHNSYLEVLFEAGLIGFILLAAFTVYIVWMMVKIFFGSFDKYPASDKFALSVLAVSFVIGMIEPMLFSFDIQSALLPSVIYLVFIVMCGVTVATAEKK